MRIGLGLPGLWLRRERGDMRVKRRRTGEGEGTDSESSSIFNRSGSGVSSFFFVADTRERARRFARQSSQYSFSVCVRELVIQSVNARPNDASVVNCSEPSSSTARSRSFMSYLSMIFSTFLDTRFTSLGAVVGPMTSFAIDRMLCSLLHSGRFMC